MFDDVIHLHRSAFHLVALARELRAEPMPSGRLRLTGRVEGDDAGMVVELHGERYQVPLASQSTPEDALRALKRHLPRGVRAEGRLTENGLELLLTPVSLPAAQVPQVRVLSTDLRQRVRMLDDNRFELLGQVGADCHLTLLVDNRRVTIALRAGLSASATAALIASRVPHGYFGLAEENVVSIWKDAANKTIAA